VITWITAAEDQSLPLVLGGVRGYRAWDLLAHITGTGGFQLEAVTSSYVFKPQSDSIYKAACLENPYHNAPEVRCKCGLYAVYDGKDARTVAYDVGAPPEISVLGAVQMFGRVIFGESGVMRGQKMKIEALIAPDI
jgi:hypothetical protein